MPPQARDKAFEEAKVLAKELGKLWKPSTNYVDGRYFPQAYIRDQSLGVTGLSLTYYAGYQLPYVARSQCYMQLVIERSDDKLVAIQAVLEQVGFMLSSKKAEFNKQIDKEAKQVARWMKSTCGGDK